MRNELHFAIEDGVLVHHFATPKTEEEALDLATEKWKCIVDFHKNNENPCGKGVRGIGGISCGLCRLYNWVCINIDNHNLICPVYRKTKFLDCDDTPYKQYACSSRFGSNDKLLEYAQAEVAFLQSLKG